MTYFIIQHCWDSLFHMYFMPALDVLFKEFHLIPDNVPSIQHNPAESVESDLLK